MPGGKKGGNKKGGEGSNQPEFKFNFAGDEEGGRKSVLDLGGKDANLLPLMQGKLNSLIGKSSGYLETLPQSVQGRVRALKKLHSDRNEIDAEYKKELAELMAKFQKRIQPLYDRRSQIVKGEIEPTKEELDFVEKKEEEAGKDESKPAAVKTEPKEETEEEKNVKGIPQFWLQAIKHHDVFMDMVTERDEEALKHLIDLKSYPVEGEPDGAFVLEFHFSPNEFFEDTVLTKTYHVDEEPMSGEIMFKNVEATEIKWKTGKNLTVKLVKVQQGGKGGGRGKRGGKAARGGKPPQSITMEKPCESFFNFFQPDPTRNGEEDIEEEELEMIFEEDYELGCIIREQIIATAVLWFTGEAMMGMEGLDMGEEYDDDEEGDSEGDEEFEPAKDANGQEVKPECNQQ